MKKLQSRSCFLLVSLLLFNAGMRLHGQAEGVGPFRTQTIELEAGWNAVYLEVEPLETEPSALFAGTPIEIVAAYFRPTTAMEFIDSPSEVLPDRKSWNVWYAPERDDALLSHLFAIQAHHAYLVYTEAAYTWSLEGSPYHDTIQWHPNAHSLVGFPINAAERPTFANFFTGSKAQAHASLQVYSLEDGRWVLVTNPESVFMEPGVAYWTYSAGASEFSGPLIVDFANSSAGGIVYSETSGAQQLTITNVSIYPQTLSLALQPGTTGLLPVAYIIRSLDGENGSIESISVPFPETLTLGPLEAGQAFSLDLEVLQEAVTVPVMSATLSIATDAGLRLEVPLVSIRGDLLTP